VPINQVARVISIKKFLSSDREAERALLHIVRVLIQGIGDHAAGGDAADRREFRESVRKTSALLAKDLTPEELLVHAGSVLQALEEFNRRSAEQHAQHSTELQLMVKMLTSTVGAVSAAGNANISRLSEIEKRVASTRELDDIRMIKSRLSDCLNDIRSEAERQRQDNRTTIAQLSQGLDDARKRSPGPVEAPAEDAITGLPSRPAAETALASATQAGAPAFAAVLVLDRLQALNMRFGRTVGDEVLIEFARTIAKRLFPKDQLFRWSGPVLMALLPRPGTIEQVRKEIAQIVETKLEHTIKTPTRSILIPIGARWAVFPMMAAPGLIYQRIDPFAALATRD
jgi:GGDEF domain-containing protein